MVGPLQVPEAFIPYFPSKRQSIMRTQPNLGPQTQVCVDVTESVRCPPACPLACLCPASMVSVGCPCSCCYFFSLFLFLFFRLLAYISQCANISTFSFTLSCFPMKFGFFKRSPHRSGTPTHPNAWGKNPPPSWFHRLNPRARTSILKHPCNFSLGKGLGRGSFQETEAPAISDPQIGKP